MENYDFIHKNSLGQWDICKNPVFIARHTFCRAIPKDLTGWGFTDLRDLVVWLNGVDEGIIITTEQHNFIKEFIW